MGISQLSSFETQRLLRDDTQTATYIVHGMRASEYEYYVALALERYQMDYWFQMNFLSGRRLRGGFIIDFLVETVPLPTPMWVHGEYWHGGKQRAIDFYQQATLRWLMQGKIMPAVVLWGKDLQTEDMARTTVKRELRL